MRMPLPGTVGFAVSDPATATLDLRDAPEGTEDQLYFLSLYGSARSTEDSFSLVQTDAQDDPQAADFPAVAAFSAIVSRLPVRGPVQMSMNGTGYALVEFEGANTDFDLQPMTVDEAAPFTLLPVVFTSSGSATLAVLPEQTVNVSVFVSNTDEDNRIVLLYTPEDTSLIPQQIVAITGDAGLPGTLNQFLRVLDRSPVIGPGTLTVTAEMASGTVAVYGWLSR